MQLSVLKMSKRICIIVKYCRSARYTNGTACSHVRVCESVHTCTQSVQVRRGLRALSVAPQLNSNDRVMTYS